MTRKLPNGAVPAAAYPHSLRRLLPASPWIILVALALFLVVGAATFLLPPSLVMAFMAGAVVVLIWLFKPEIVTYALLVTRASIDGFMEAFTLFGGSALSMNLSGAVNSLAVGLGFLSLLRRLLRRQPILGAAPGLTYAILLMVGLLSLPNAVDPAAGIKEWARLASGLAIYLMLGDVVHDERDRGRAVTVILLSSLMPLALGLAQWLTGSGYFFAGFVGTEFAYRPQGTFSHPAVFGSYLMVVLSLAIAVYFSTPRLRARVSVALLAATAGLSLVLTMARTQWLGMMVSVLTVGLVKKRKLALIALAVALLLVLAVPLLRERLGAAESVLWRINVWQVAVQFAWPPTLLGRGLASSGWYINQFLPTVETHPHNDYLKVGIELGFLGWAAYAAWIAALLIHAGGAYRRAVDPAAGWRALALLGIVLAGAVIAIAGNYLGNTAVQWYFWALAALVPANESTGSPLARRACRRLS